MSFNYNNGANYDYSGPHRGCAAGSLVDKVGSGLKAGCKVGLQLEWADSVGLLL